MKQEEVVHWFHVDEVPTSTPEEYNFKVLQIVSPATQVQGLLKDY